MHTREKTAFSDLDKTGFHPGLAPITQPRFFCLMFEIIAEIFAFFGHTQHPSLNGMLFRHPRALSLQENPEFNFCARDNPFLRTNLSAVICSSESGAAMLEKSNSAQQGLVTTQQQIGFPEFQRPLPALNVTRTTQIRIWRTYCSLGWSYQCHRTTEPSRSVTYQIQASSSLHYLHRYVRQIPRKD